MRKKFGHPMMETKVLQVYVAMCCGWRNGHGLINMSGKAQLHLINIIIKFYVFVKEIMNNLLIEGRY